MFIGNISNVHLSDVKDVHHIKCTSKMYIGNIFDVHLLNSHRLFDEWSDVKDVQSPSKVTPDFF